MDGRNAMRLPRAAAPPRKSILARYFGAWAFHRIAVSAEMGKGAGNLALSFSGHGDLLAGARRE
jgi:hypothetical protein